MEAPWLTPTKEGKDCSVSWEGYGLGCLWCRWYSYGRLSPKGADNQLNILCFTSYKQLRENIIVKCPGKLSNGALFHQENASAHMSVIALTAIIVCGFELIQHPTYLSDLAPKDFHLFPVEKGHFWCHAFSVRWWHNTCSGGLSGHLRNGFLWEWQWGLSTLLAQVYRQWGGLCWKIHHKNIPIKFWPP